MFTTFIVQPIFNLLVLIYALLPGHNFGLAIILFTIVIRLLLWPLVVKQLHQAKAMRKLQPELSRIKKETKGDKRKEQELMMALYKEHNVNPFGSIGILIIQLPILIALYDGLRRVVLKPRQIVDFAYPALRHLPWMRELAANIHRFDSTLLGGVDLTRAAFSKSGIYWPALAIVVGSAVIQYYQSKQLLVTGKNTRSLREILRDANAGKEADQSELSAAVTGVTRYFIPIMVLSVTIRLASALGLYWLVSGIVAYIQQWYILREDETEIEKMIEEPNKKDAADIPEAEVVAAKPAPKQTPPKAKSARHKKKRRKR